MMVTLDGTIAIIALPRIQSSLSASQEQVAWVLTSYLLAGAIATPLSGWLADRFGRNRTIAFSILGFTLSSIGCGSSANLEMLVFFRFIQGMSGASLMPLTQVLLLDINPPERHGPAIALFGIGSLFGPMIGPTLGGWLTEFISWRWIFFINIPVGVLGFVGFTLIAKERLRQIARPFDLQGFVAVALTLASLQLMLDRGQTLDWFSSTEICVEAAIAGTALWLYLAHTLTSRHALFPTTLLRDRNFQTSAVFGFFFSSLTFTSFALMPLMMQGVLGYSAIHAGMLSMPRGVVMFVILQFMGRVDALVDRRILITIGLSFFVLTFWQMSQFDLSMDGNSIVWATVLQGIGQGILFVPLSTLGFLTIPPDVRADAAAATSFIRNIGGSISVAVIQAMTVANTQTMHASLAAHVGREVAEAQSLPPYFSPDTTAGAMALNAEISRQALMVAYIDDFRLLSLIALLSLPLVLLIRQPKKRTKDEGPMVLEAHG
jgi:DHA2 family multidrug resistance protein